MNQDLVFEKRGRVAWLTINREARGNALNLEVIDWLGGCLDRIERDEDIRVVCLTGAGDKAFCTGADLLTAAGGSIEEGARRYAALLERLHSFPRPLVARVNGHCLAGGLGLMLSCDLAYAVEGARFATPEVNVGLFPLMIGALIFRNAGRKKALEMVYTARRYSAAEAEAMGLITRWYPAGEFDRAVEEVLSVMAEKGPLAMSLGRRALAAVEGLELGPALDHLCDGLVKLMASEDAAEGLAAFLEKRQPRWKNR
ncbi:MAG: enoyl-CoA hydratase-related protein [Thermodesulfobacteriota bacterium]